MMKSRAVPLVVLSLAALALVGAVVMFWTSPDAVARRQREQAVTASRGGEARAAAVSDVSAEVLHAVRAHLARREVGSVTAELSAVLAPIRSVVVAAEVGGRVVAVGAEEHEWVEAGEVLI